MINEFEHIYQIKQITAKERNHICLDGIIQPDRVSSEKYDHCSIRFMIHHVPSQRCIGTAQVIPASCLPPGRGLPILFKKNNDLENYLKNYPELHEQLGEIRDIRITQFRPRLTISLLMRAALEICICHDIHLIIMPLNPRIALILNGMGVEIFPLRTPHATDKKLVFYFSPLSLLLENLYKKNQTLWGICHK